MPKTEPVYFLHRPPLFRAACINSFARGFMRDEVGGGVLVRHARGLYSRPAANVSNTEAVLFRARHSIAALDTALWLLGVRATEPSTIWIALSQDSRRPHLPPLKIETLRWSQTPDPQDVMTFGRPELKLTMRVFNLAKTAVDFIRARNRVGIERASAVVDLLLERRLTAAELVACAERYGAAYPVRRYLAGRRKRR